MTDSANRLVVFDCDGTLVDSQRGIIASVEAAFLPEGLCVPDDEMIRTGVGLPLEVAIARLAPDADDAQIARLVARYREAFFTLRQKPDFVEPLYPGTVEVITALEEAGFLLAVATGKSRRGLRATLERHGILDRFVVLKTADDGPGKPDPSILKDAMAEAGALPGTTAMVGDTSYDILMARAARARAIGVTWGYHDAATLRKAGAETIIRRYSDLIGHVSSMLM